MAAKGTLVPLMRRPETWGLILWNRIDDEEEGVDESRAFGNVAAKAARAQRTEATWTFPGKWRWNVHVYQGVHHTLITPDGDELQVGRDDPHPVLPILRWQELQLMDAAAKRDPMLVLVLAAATQAQTKAELEAASSRYAEALVECCKLKAPKAQKIAALLADRSSAWKEDKKLGWITTAASSRRNPKGHFGKPFAKAKGFAVVKDFFASLS